MDRQPTYKEIRTMEFPGLIARVYIPELTSEERAKRMKRIHNEAAKLLKEELHNAR